MRVEPKRSDNVFIIGPRVPTGFRNLKFDLGPFHHYFRMNFNKMLN